MLELTDIGFESWPWFGYYHGFLINQYSDFHCLYRFWRCNEYPCTLSTDLGFVRCWRYLMGVWNPNIDLYVDNCFFIHIRSGFCLSTWIIKVQRTSMSFKSCLGLRGHWKFLNAVLKINLDMYMVTGLLFTHALNLGCLHICGRCKVHPYPQSLYWGLEGHWRFQTGVLNLDPDLDMVTGAKNTNYLYVLIRVLEDARGSRLGSETWSKFGYCHYSLIHPYLNFGCLHLIWKCKESLSSLNPDCSSRGHWKF